MLVKTKKTNQQPYHSFDLTVNHSYFIYFCDIAIFVVRTVAVRFLCKNKDELPKNYHFLNTSYHFFFLARLAFSLLKPRSSNRSEEEEEEEAEEEHYNNLLKALKFS